MKTVNIKGKNYVPVNERLKEFRNQYPKYSLRTELVAVDSNSALVKAIIRDEQDRIIAEGTAHERADNLQSMVNKTSHVENAETSAWGRALGNFGIGIDASVATADEVANAVANQNAPAKPKAPSDPVATQEQRLRVSDLCQRTGISALVIVDKFKIGKVMTAAQAIEAITYLEKELNKQLDAAA